MMLNALYNHYCQQISKPAKVTLFVILFFLIYASIHYAVLFWDICFMLVIAFALAMLNWFEILTTVLVLDKEL